MSGSNQAKLFQHHDGPILPVLENDTLLPDNGIVVHNGRYESHPVLVGKGTNDMCLALPDNR